MSLGVNKSKLEAVTRELLAKWDYTKEHWADTKAQEFEKKYIEELVTGLGAAGAVIEQLDKLVNKIRSDCE